LVQHNQTNAPHAQLRNVSGSNIISGNLLLNSGGARWDIGSDAGHLKLTGAVSNIANVASADTWRTLYLTGPGSGEFAGTMQDTTNGLSKLNLTILSGDWTLSGSNKAYTGNTIVSNGVLRVHTGLSSLVEVRAAGTFAGTGSTSTNLQLTNGSTILRPLTNWASPGSAFTAARVVASAGTTNWNIRLDGSGLSGFSETPKTVPILTGTLSNITTSQITLTTSNFPGRGSWATVTNASDISLTYTPVALAMDTLALPNCFSGNLYQQQFLGTGGVSPHLWTVFAGELPPGLTLSSSGLLSGTPSLPGDYSVEIQLADAAGINVRRIFLISIDAPLAITTAALDSATANVPYSRQLGVTGGVPTYNWSVQAGSLPPGMSLSEDGFLSGTPTTNGTFAFTLSVDDQDSQSSPTQQTFNLTVAEPPFLAWSHSIQWDKVVPSADPSPAADPDQDGISNLLEYAYGLDPLAANEKPVTSTMVSDGMQTRLQIRFQRSAAASDLVFRVEGSANLVDWSPVAEKTPGSQGSFIPLDGSAEILENSGEVIVTDSATSDTSPRRFLRLRVSQ
jgi:autotransporter-associated beta strand protein